MFRDGAARTRAESEHMDFTSNTPVEKLPRDYEAERYLLSAVLFWPERAVEILPLVEPGEMLDELHQRVWAAFRGQLALRGEIDALEVGKRLGCCFYLCQLYDDAATSCHAGLMAKRIRNQAQGRQLYDTLHKAKQAILEGHPVAAVLPRLNVVLSGFGGVTA